MAETNPFVPTLPNHPFFDANLIPAGTLASLCDELWPLVLAHLPESRKKPYGVEHVFRSLLANLISAMQTGEPVLVVPRNKKFFPATTRYRPKQATYHSVIKALDVTGSSGLIIQELGSGHFSVTCNLHGDLKCVREATRISPTNHLTQQLTHVLSHPIHSLTQWMRDTELIHLRIKTQDKASSSEQVNYSDTPMTNTFRSEVRRINLHLTDHPCHYTGRHRINLMDDHVIRIFNNGDWNQGGRLYGYWPMNLPKGERHRLSIDSEPLADLDFGSCFVALLHVYDGTEFDPDAPDPFTIKGYRDQRDLIKQCAYSILNASKRIKNYPDNITQEHDSRPTMKWREMEETVFTHVPLFERYAYTGLGLKLMRMESDILIKVLLDLIEQGIGFVPMHDGIMVPESKKQLTHNLMLKNYRAITGQGIKIKEKTIRKPSDHTEAQSYV